MVWTKGDWLEAFLFAISVAVGLTPEMLPMIVTTCLAKGAMSMSKKKTIVKNLNSIQNFGAMDVLCTDKTGTLTQNRMTVIEAYNAPGRALEKPEQIRNRMLLENFCVNGTADVTFPGATEAEAGAMPEFIGNPTECALLVAAHKAGLDYRIRRERATVLHTYPFSSETKSMTTVVRDGDGITVFAKGSPEKMLDLCAVDARRAAKSNGRSRSSRRSPAECSASPTAIFPIRTPTLRLSITLPTAPAWNPA